MTTPTGAPVSPAAAPASGLASADGHVWHTLSAGSVLAAETVDQHLGLSPAEAATRVERYGLNKFDAGQAEPRWRAFLRQYTDLMQLVLLVAGLVSLLLQEWETGIVLILLTLFNSVLGLQQEGKAAAAVSALQQMMIIKARVIRDGQLQELPAEQLVPGDIVAIEAGDIVPADGRLLRAATLEIAESALAVVTFSLYALFFSIEARDERRTAFSLDTFSDSKFVIATAVSVLTLLLTTVFGPLQKFLKTTSLDVRQWLICVAVALSIVVASEIRKAVRRRSAPHHEKTR